MIMKKRIIYDLLADCRRGKAKNSLWKEFCREIRERSPITSFCSPQEQYLFYSLTNIEAFVVAPLAVLSCAYASLILGLIGYRFGLKGGIQNDRRKTDVERIYPNP